jgi:hypothetical protein
VSVSLISMTEDLEPGVVQAIIESSAPRDEKLRELSKLIRGTDEPATVAELFAALRGFAPAERAAA